MVGLAACDEQSDQIDHEDRGEQHRQPRIGGVFEPSRRGPHFHELSTMDTFFHFPTKEHVLLELERREEERMAGELNRFFANPHTVRQTLAEAVELLVKLERRLGQRLFKDILALHFSTTRPQSDEWTNHPILIAFVEELRSAQERSEIPEDVDVMLNVVSYLVGLYALLLTIPDSGDLRGPASPNTSPPVPMGCGRSQPAPGHERRLTCVRLIRETRGRPP